MGRKDYYKRRRLYRYYVEIKKILEGFGCKERILDVGCKNTPIITWGDFQERYSVDMNDRPNLNGVTKIIGKWPDVKERVPYCNVACCLQTIEHVPDYRLFVDALFEAADTIIISLPYKWKIDQCKEHVHDPIDKDKILRMIGRKHDYDIIVKDAGLERIILTYRNKIG